MEYLQHEIRAAGGVEEYRRNSGFAGITRFQKWERELADGKKIDVFEGLSDGTKASIDRFINRGARRVEPAPEPASDEFVDDYAKDPR